MNVKAIKTSKIQPGEKSIFSVIDTHVSSLRDKSVLAVTSKIVALCEDRVVPLAKADKEKLIINEADYYLPSQISKYGYHFAIKYNTLIAAAGIDESNSKDNYVLWPKNPQKTANQIRQYLVDKFDVKEVGVIITDSTCQPLRWGTVGISLAHSGFRALNNYVGSPDLFGRPFEVTRANIAGGLAAAAVVVMGEGAEQTPICVIEELEFVEFQRRDPTQAELSELIISRRDDLFGPFLNSVSWKKGGGARR